MALDSYHKTKIFYFAGEYLIHFLALCHRKETLDQLIGSLASSTADAGSHSSILHLSGDM